MSRLWLNVRFGVYHLQAGQPRWWSVSWGQNQYHVDNPPDSWFQIFCLLGWRP